MFTKYKGVFQSRWKAVLWAAGVCLTAYCTVPSADDTHEAEVPAFLAPHAEPSHAAKDPWALDRPDAGRGAGAGPGTTHG